MTARLIQATRDLCETLSALRFSAPVSHVYNPLVYAREPHELYLKRYARGRKRVVFLGMNPGPFGMAQTGVPFGEIAAVRDFLGITGQVHAPEHSHPKRPISGFDCTRSEVSGRRLWGAIEATYTRPEAFFEQHFVANYCPLVFMEAGGKNRTPDKLPVAERGALYAGCDVFLRQLVDVLRPDYVVGIGKFAEDRAAAALQEDHPHVQVAGLLHPSPANPQANAGWAGRADMQLRTLGLPGFSQTAQ